MSELLETIEGLVPKFTNPVAHLSTQIAEGGEIPDTSADGSVCVEDGFSKRYSTPPWETDSDSGLSGRYLDRGEMNKWAYLVTSLGPFLNRGGWYTFDQKVSAKIGGYPKGAVLWWRDTKSGEMLRVVSMKDDNTEAISRESLGITGDGKTAQEAPWKICSYSKAALLERYGDTISAKVASAPDAVEMIDAPAMGRANLVATNVTRYAAADAVWAHLAFTDFAGLTLVRGGTRRKILSRRECRAATFCLPLAEGDAVESPTPFSVRAIAQRPKLPYDEEVDYVESSGTQYIDTGIAYSPGMRSELDIKFGTSGNMLFFGARTAANTTKCYNAVWLYSSAAIRFDYCNSGAAPQTQNITPNNSVPASTRISLAFDGATLTYPGGTLTATLSAQSFSTDFPLYLFGVNTAGTASLTAGATITLYGCKIYSGGVLVRDYIPVRVGTAGALYDRANPTGGPQGDGLYFSGTDTPLTPGNVQS